MADKSWMLNPQGIRAAKACIHCVKKELDIKLTLSNPDFMSLLHEYVDRAHSEELNLAYSQLLALAGVGNLMQDLKSSAETQSAAQPLVAQAAGDEFNMSNSDTVTFRGKVYERYRQGKQFAGLYRGQPRYV
ncbi:hypothetical protein SAMN02745866_03496 [Alteromonadaceae bacterium Bs31]|nr:hypothetical protein SAMN02745866_03496 [Alteromonadaceae bacterium Bs31]